MSTPLLDGITVVDLSQFLSGPLASLRLADLGARVIKVERPDGGDLCRRLYLSDTEIGGESTLFHAINRGKESFAADLKDPRDLDRVCAVIATADVMIQNFRPGVIERLGLDYEHVRALNPRLVYGTITGYGATGPWSGLPGQDLLAQARSGLMWLSGDPDQGPVPFGLAVADMAAGNILAQGILAGLVRRGVTGTGVHVETSLLEALLDLQFEVLTTHMNDGGRVPARAGYRNAHAYLAAPYGVYPTADGWLALAMMPMPRLAAAMDMPELTAFDADAAFLERDAIKRAIAARLATRTTADWLAVFEPADLWCAEVLDWPAVLAGEAADLLAMVQIVEDAAGRRLRTTRLPLRIDGERPSDRRAAPTIGQDTRRILDGLGE